MKTKILIIVGAVVLLGGGIFGGMMLGKMKGASAEETGTQSVEDEIKQDAEGGGHGAEAEESQGDGGHGGSGNAATDALMRISTRELTFEFDKFQTNLSDLKTFVIVNIQVETFPGKGGKRIIEKHVAPLRDATIMILSSKAKEDLRTIAGKERLKRELIARYEGIINQPKSIRFLNFVEFTIMQF